jgi:hypothetical protein
MRPCNGGFERSRCPGRLIYWLTAVRGQMNLALSQRVVITGVASVILDKPESPNS